MLNSKDLFCLFLEGDKNGGLCWTGLRTKKNGLSYFSL